jgi:thiol-disulfide isomerase/thioredoxin
MRHYNMITYSYTILAFGWLASLAPNVNAQPFPSAGKEAHIHFYLSPLRDSLTFWLRLGVHVYDGYGKENIDNPVKQTAYTCKVANHAVDFIVAGLAEPRYGAFRYYGYALPIDFEVMIDPGDSVSITDPNGELTFSGRGAGKYACAYELQALSKGNQFSKKPSDPGSVLVYFKKMDTLALQSLAILEKHKKELRASDYWLLKGQITSTFQTAKCMDVTGGRRGYGVSVPGQQKYLPIPVDYRSPIWNAQIKKELTGNEVLQHSVRFSNYLIDQYIYDSCLASNKAFNLAKCCSYFARLYQGSAREWLLYSLLGDFRLQSRYPNHQAIIRCIDHALASGYIKNASVRRYFVSIKPSLLAGSLAYNFSLPDTKGNMVRLSDFKGTVVLVDFWFFGCGNCAQVHPYLDSIGDLYSKKDFQVISICLEEFLQYKEKWLRPNKERDKYTSEGDVNLWAANAEGARAEIFKYYHITGCPYYLLIDKEGKQMEQIIDPRLDKGKDLTDKISKALSSK